MKNDEPVPGDIDKRFDMAEHNADMFRERNVVEFFANAPIKPAEVVLFLSFISAFQGKSVLDLGVGAGRTTQYLSRFAGRYVGVDCSREMLSHCASRFPDAELVFADIRNLSVLGSDKFDFILASCMVVDGFSHTDREALLRDTRDRLAPEGVFAFSAHNRAHFRSSHGPKLAMSRNPVTQIRFIWEYLISMRNHRRMKPFEERHETYALLNDTSFSWKGMVYHIDRAAQEIQLRDAGFTIFTVLDTSGNALGPDDAGRSSSELYYVCGRT